MPTESQHSGKCHKNREFLSTIDVGRFPEWAATVAFYVAVHAVERLRAISSPPTHSENHFGRSTFVKGHHRAIFSYYKDLYSISRLARYDSTADIFNEVSSGQVQDELICKALKHIEQYVEGAVAAAKTS